MALTPALLAASAVVGWSTPATVDTDPSGANPIAVGSGAGGVVTGWLRPVMSLSRRSGDTFGPLRPLIVANQFEKAWTAGLDDDGRAVVLTVRKHLPVQRIRAILVSPTGVRTGPRTISDRTHSASQPVLDVAPDGTAAAAWVWHDRRGWRAQAAILRPGASRFGAPQNVSPPAPVRGRQQYRPWVHVAAGDGGRAVLAWQIGGTASLPEAPLHVRTAVDGVFGPDQSLPDAGGLAGTALAVGPGGAVQVAYADQHFTGNEAPAKLHVSQGTAGEPLSAPQVLSTGGIAVNSGSSVAADFSGDGAATVAWARPTNVHEAGGAIETFTRTPGGSTFGPVQTLAPKGQGVELAGGPGRSTVVAWMTGQFVPRLSWTVHAAVRGAADAAFAPETTISSPDRQALWPTVAMTASGDAIAAWVTNTDGSGGGTVEAAAHRP